MDVFTHRQRQAPGFPELPARRWLLALLAAMRLALTFTVAPFEVIWE